MSTPKPLLEAESTVTDRYQTTVPEPVRKILRIKKRDKIRYTILDNGDVIIKGHNDDPVLSNFLNFLAKDLHDNPHRVQALDSKFVENLKDIVKDVEIDLDAPLSDKDE